VAFSSYNTNLQGMLVTQPEVTLCDPEGVIRPKVTSQGFGTQKYPVFYAFGKVSHVIGCHIT